MITFAYNKDSLSALDLRPASLFCLTLSYIIDKIQAFHGDTDFELGDDLIDFILSNIDNEITDDICRALSSYAIDMYTTRSDTLQKARLLLHICLYIAKRHHFHGAALSCRTLMVMHGFMPFSELNIVLHDPRPVGFDAKAQCFLVLGAIERLDVNSRYFFYESAYFLARELPGSDELIIFKALMSLAASRLAHVEVNMNSVADLAHLSALRFLCLKKFAYDFYDEVHITQPHISLSADIKFHLRGVFARFRSMSLHQPFLEYIESV